VFLIFCYFFVFITHWLYLIVTRIVEYVQLFASIYLIIGNFSFVSCFSRCKITPNAYAYPLWYIGFIIYFDIRFGSSFLFSAMPVCYLYRELCWCHILSFLSMKTSGASWRRVISCKYSSSVWIFPCEQVDWKFCECVSVVSTVRERNRDGNKEGKKGKLTARKKWSRGEKGNKREKNFRVFHGGK